MKYEIYRNRQLFGFVLMVIVFLSLTPPLLVHASHEFQLTPFPTPTPGPDGRIIYIVQPNDTLIRISLISGVSMEELRGLNNLTDETIVVGQELLLGLGGPSVTTSTPGPSPTPTAVLPTPSPQPGFGNLCILLYNDRNGDSIRQGEESSIAEGAISVSNIDGSVSLTASTTRGDEAYCFEELPEDKYTVSVAVPDGYNATTESDYVITLNAGDETYLDFGAQVNSKSQSDDGIIVDSGGKSPILGILGGLLLLSGIGLGVFARRMFK